MKKRKHRILALLFAIVLALSMTTTAFATVLVVTRYQQESPTWCWAAVIKMVGEYQNPLGKSQSDIVRAVKGSVSYTYGSIYEIALGCNRVYGLSYTGYASTFSWSTIHSTLGRLHPVGIIVDVESGWQHALTIYGDNSTTTGYYFYNPSVGYGGGYTATHAAMINGFTMEGETARWTQTAKSS